MLRSRFGICLALVLFLSFQPIQAQTIDEQKSEQIAALVAAGIHLDDLALIEQNRSQLSLEQLDAIVSFLTNPAVIADRRWFDVSAYTSWDDYNFRRPIGDTVLAILARRDLFLDAARELNNLALTNMSPEALAALTFAQTYVEEKWDHQPPWDGDGANPIFNWVHPVVLDQPNVSEWLYSDELDQLRAEYWWATYFSFPLGVLQRLGIGKGTDVDEALRGMRPPNANVPRLAGYAYPVGNQLYLQTAETAYWYTDYRAIAAQRYGAFTPQALDTRIDFPAADSEFDPAGCDANATASPPEFAQYPGLCQLFNAPFAAELRRELTQSETAAFWNVMRFVYTGARQREGGASPDFPNNGQPAIFALRYAVRSPEPVGRSVADVSAFALLTTVYSDSILLDFTNWDANRAALIVTPSDTTRSDGIDRQVSERNKAIYVIEHLGSEAIYPNATHVSGSRGLDLHLVTQYADPTNGDFLPYTSEEAAALVSALVTEAREYQVEASRLTLCNSPLLRMGYESYLGVVAWSEQTNLLCA